MESARVKRALELVDEAMELDTEHRSGFIRDACQDDDELRLEVEQYLKFESGVSIAPQADQATPFELPDVAAADRYELGDEIGRGGMGVIVEAYDRVLDRQVAVKLLLPEHADHPDLLRRFVGEARIGASLQHPGVAPVYDLGRIDDGRPMFAMKLVRGKTLSTILADRDDEEARLLAIFQRLCQTVAYAHSNEIIHRDVKPANVMVGQFGEVQLMDWGLAKQLHKNDVSDEEDARIRDAVGGTDKSPVETRFGLAMGTPAYMPPEQSVGRRDKTTDVFALGAILCEILTGKPPYVAPSATKVTEASLRGDTEAAYERLDQCGRDEDLVALAKKCLAIAPQDRCRDAGEVARQISAYQEATQLLLQSAEVAAARAEAVSREERKRRRVTAALAAAALTIVVIVSGGWIWLSRQRAQRERERSEQQARRSSEIDSALGKASDHYDRAMTAPVTDFDPWIEARAAVARAESLVQTESVGDEYRHKVKVLRTRIDKGESARKLVMAIETARETLFTNPQFSEQSLDMVREAIEAAFRQHDLHPDSRSATDAAATVANFSANVRNEVIGALDQWLLHANVSQRQWLLEVLSESDDDPWRVKWREAYVRDDRNALESMFRDAELRHEDGRSILNIHQSVREFVNVERQAKALRLVQPLHADDFWLNVRLAELAWRQERSFDSLSYYAAAAAIRPSGPLHNRVGDVLWAVDRRAEAQRHYSKAELLFKHENQEWAELAKQLAAANSQEERIAVVEKALQLQPESVAANVKFAGLLRASGKKEEAIQLMRRAVELHPENYWCRIHLTAAVLDTGDILETVRTFEPWLEHLDDRRHLSQIRAWSLQALTSAIAALDQQVAKSGPSNEEELAYFAGQAREWMDVYLQARMPPKLERLLEDQRFASVREPEHLAKLPLENRREWESFWSNIRSRNERVKAKHAAQAKTLEALSWIQLNPESMQSTGGAVLVLSDDGSILASGKIVRRDVYVIDATAPSRLAAVRLDVLTDAALPNNGPGRHETGNFHLADIKIEVSDEQTGETENLPIDRAWASYAWKDRPVEFAIDDNPQTAWHVFGKTGRPHWAVFALEQPHEATNPAKIRITLRHTGELGTVLGRFRVLTTSDLVGGPFAQSDSTSVQKESSNWHPIEPDKMKSKAGADMTLEPDTSILVSGVNEPNDDYIIEAPIEAMSVASIRLDVIADPRLPNKGPGRHETGNFQLGEVLVERLDKDSEEPKNLPIASAWASYAWKERPIERTIDDNLSTAWHVWGEMSKSHHAIFTLDEPIEATEPWKIRITLRHGGDLGPGIGRFRLSVTADSSPR